MKIIVEAGGTKCKWGLIDNQIRTAETIGFNPNCGHPDGLLGIAQAVAEVAKTNLIRCCILARVVEISKIRN